MTLSNRYRRGQRWAVVLPVTILTTVLVFGGSTLAADAPAAHAGIVAQVAPAAVDSRRGMLLFLQCRACHSLDSGDGHLVGPNLSGLFGMVAGKQEGFIYSESAAASDVVWDEDTLDAFLARPNDFFPGTKMAFAGVAVEADRAALIQYLREQTRQRARE